MKNQKQRRNPEPVGEIDPGSVEVRVEKGFAGFSRPPLARMLRLHECLVANRYPNCRKIAEEFEMSAKTVQRDVNFMRDRMGLPIEYDRKRFGFHYTRPVGGFPAPGASRRKARGNPWGKSLPPPIGEKPALGTAGGHGVAVRIRFDPDSARAVRARTWHATQIIRASADGGVEMTVRTWDEEEIARWVLSWAAHAWVIDPARLRNRVREIAREILARH